MKKILLLIGMIAIALTSCNKLDELSDNRVEQIDTPEKIKNILTSAYPKTTNTYITELASDNIADNGANVPGIPFFAIEATYWKPIKEYWDTDGLHNFWQYHYESVSLANEALQAIEKLGNTQELQPAKGEALLIRAYAHFCLVTTFSKMYNPHTSNTDLGIPYAKTIEENLIVKYPRGTVAQVYQQIESDLETGLPLIEDRYYQLPKYHFNKKAAYAFAARFYLYYQKWQKALDAANVVLSGDVSELLRNWKAFRDGANVGSSTKNNFAMYYTKESIEANLMLQPTFTNMLEAYYLDELYDARFTHNTFVANNQTLGTKNLWDQDAFNANNGYPLYWFTPFVNTTGGKYIDIVNVGKFPRFRRSSSNYGTIIVPFTTDETLLVRAEAKVMLSDLQGAMDDLNLWTKAYITDYKEQNGVRTAHINTGFTIQNVKDFYDSIDYATNTPEGVTQKKHLHPSFTLVEGSDQEAMIQYILQCRRVLTLGEGLRWQDVRRYNIEVPRYQKYGNSGAYQVPDILTSGDNRNTFQLPDEVLGAGMEPNPR